MGHDEQADITNIILKEQTAMSSAHVGKLILSGSKINVANGTAWEVVNSA